MLTIDYDESPCGTGKTHRAIEKICHEGGRHLFVVDRCEVIRERKRMVFDMMQDDVPLHVETIFAKSGFRSERRSVRGQVERVPKLHGEKEHALVFITHEAMKLTDFESFAKQGWTIWIDEIPSILDHDKHRFCVMWEKLEQTYSLDPDGPWSRVRLRDPKLDLSELRNDDGFQVLAPFHRRVTDPRREVLVNISDWSELAEKGKEVSWYSVWSPHELRHFERAVMLGNALRHSMTFRIWQEKWPDIEWRSICGSSPAFLPREVNITYYAHAHRASRSLFNHDSGRRNLGKIAYAIQSSVPPKTHIWMCNEADEESLFRMKGERLSPRKAGSNDFAWATNVTAIYTAKPDPALIGVYKRLGVDEHHHTVSAELETILQFVCRSAIRTANDGRPVNFRVYDKHQADYLRDYFERDPLRSISVRVGCKDLGFANDFRDSRPGRKPRLLTAEERAAKQENDRAKDRDRKRKKRREANENLAA